MKKTIGCIAVFGILALIIAISLAVPVSLEPEVDFEFNDDYVEDDMIITVLRNGERAPWRKWPNANVYYKISKDFDDSQVASIKSAMAAIEAVSCVRFYEATRRRQAYVDMKADPIGCNAALGYQGRRQSFNLQKNITKCFLVPVIIHELLHTLGFYHQHTAPDRDDYVTIVWDNIQPGKERWFSKFDNKTISDYGYGYDYDSIMHYARKAFSVNGSETIVPLESDAKIGQSHGLSMKDIGKINAMYRCPTEIVIDSSDF